MKSLFLFPVFLLLPGWFIHAQNVVNDLKLSDALRANIENEVDGGFQSIKIVTETDDDFGDAYISLVEACEVNHSNLNIVRVEVVVEENKDLVYVGILNDAQTEISIGDIVARGKRSNDSDMGLESTRWLHISVWPHIGSCI